MALAFLTAPVLWCQEVPQTQDQKANVQTYIDLLRQNVRTQKVSIMSAMMQLTPDQASKFWPIYNEYDKDLTKLNNEKLAGIKLWAQNEHNVTDALAGQLANKALDLESRRTDLKKKYMGQISEALSPKIGARFLQIENQLLMIIDLQIASNLPIVE
jgi:hypothetical protein